MRRGKNLRGEFENHTKGFGSSYMKKFGFADGKGLGKQEQGTNDPIQFIKNYRTKGVGKRNVVDDMKQLGTKSNTTLLSCSRALKIQQIHYNLRQRPIQSSQARNPSHMPHKIASMPIMC
jgi:hypothetical protein